MDFSRFREKSEMIAKDQNTSNAFRYTLVLTVCGRRNNEQKDTRYFSEGNSSVSLISIPSE